MCSHPRCRVFRHQRDRVVQVAGFQQQNANDGFLVSTYAPSVTRRCHSIEFPSINLKTQRDQMQPVSSTREVTSAVYIVDIDAGTCYTR